MSVLWASMVSVSPEINAMNEISAGINGTESVGISWLISNTAISLRRLPMIFFTFSFPAEISRWPIVPLVVFYRNSQQRRTVLKWCRIIHSK